MSPRQLSVPTTYSGRERFWHQVISVEVLLAPDYISISYNVSPLYSHANTFDQVVAGECNDICLPGRYNTGSIEASFFSQISGNILFLQMRKKSYVK